MASPLISLVPTLIFLQFFPDGGKDRQNWQIFLGSTPLFWVAHFVAGMLMSRIFGISKFETAWRGKSRPWLPFGDLALAAVLVLSLMPPHDLAWRHILRHGALLPLYMLVLYDLALGRGLVARLFSLPGMTRGPAVVLHLHLAEPVPDVGLCGARRGRRRSTKPVVLVCRDRAARYVRDQHALHREAAGATLAQARSDPGHHQPRNGDLNISQGVTDCPCVATQAF